MHALAPALLFLASGLHAQPAPDSATLTRLLEEFLSGASRNDAAIHGRFWAEDLIYTGSAGRRIGKADIMSGLRAPAPTPGQPTTTYSAEDVRIHQYGDTAVVAFRLIGTTEVRGKLAIMSFFNTGTFLERDGVWRVVAWQATRIPPSADEARKEVEDATAAFHRAILDADVETLVSIADEGFVWTHDTEQVTRQQLADRIRSGELRFSRIETSPVTVAVHGETAVARGASLRQRADDTEPLTIFYTYTFVREGGAWKAVALHTSLP
jgi:hypothetical protein